MTSTGLAASSLEKGTAPQDERRRAAACAFCLRRLAGEFFFTCRKCDASYCYIHMSRHQPVSCARQVRRRRRDGVTGQPVHVVVAEVRAEVPLVLAESALGPGPSANV